MKIDAAGKEIELILSDVDGVLTGGEIVFDNQGIETKSFHVRDGLGIKLWQRAGFKFGVVSARASHIVKIRSAELGVDIIRQGFEDKRPAVQEIVADLKLDPSQVCYIADDLPDLPVMHYVAIGVAVADAAPEVRAAADFVTKLPGGRGAVRELVEVLLRSKNRWDEVIRRYTG